MARTLYSSRTSPRLQVKSDCMYEAEQEAKFKEVAHFALTDILKKTFLDIYKISGIIMPSV